MPEYKQMVPVYEPLACAAYDLALEYLNHGWGGDAVPSISALALYVKHPRMTLYKWRNSFQEWAQVFETILAMQERELINKGLRGEFNPTITMRMLCRHGYAEKVESDHTSSDGSMTPTVPTYKIVKE